MMGRPGISPWSQRMAAETGKLIRFHRDRQDMSAQQLADRCAELGEPSISRTVITKLENGRREAVSTAELQVLAFALGVAPAKLLFPVDRAETVEFLPGQHVDPYRARAWFDGQESDTTAEREPTSLTIDLDVGSNQFLDHLREAIKRYRRPPEAGS